MSHYKARRKEKRNEAKRLTRDVQCLLKTKFNQLQLSDHLLQGLTHESFIECSPIQQRAIPLGRSGLDLLVQAKSGTGKTLVFGIIAVEAFQASVSGPQSLVLAPTREIAVQIEETIRKIAQFVPRFRIESFIGGMDLAEDRRKIQGCRALVGTPGRILHLITNGVLKTSDLRLFVLDEADQLMGDSFRNDIRSIRKRLPKAIQTLAVSATFDNNLDLELAKMMNHPVGVTPCREVPILLGVKQLALVLPFDPAAPAPNSMNDMFAKVKAMHTVFSMVAFNQTLVFSNSQSRAESYCNYLRQNGWPTEVISGNQPQPVRLALFKRFKANAMKTLIATDLMARGIDSEHVNLVINLEVPDTPTKYLHRIGRAGRFGTQGISITLIGSQDELDKMRFILGTLGKQTMFVTKFPAEDYDKDIWEFTTMDVREMVFGMSEGELAMYAKRKKLGRKSDKKSEQRAIDDTAALDDDQVIDDDTAVDNDDDNDEPEGESTQSPAPEMGGIAEDSLNDDNNKRLAFENVLMALHRLNYQPESALSYSPLSSSHVKNPHSPTDKNVELLRTENDVVTETKDLLDLAFDRLNLDVQSNGNLQIDEDIQTQIESVQLDAIPEPVEPNALTQKLNDSSESNATNDTVSTIVSNTIESDYALEIPIERDTQDVNALLCSVENQIQIQSETVGESKTIDLPDDLFDIPNNQTHEEMPIIDSDVPDATVVVMGQEEQLTQNDIPSVDTKPTEITAMNQKSNEITTTITNTIDALLCSVEQQIDLQMAGEYQPIDLPDDLFDVAPTNHIGTSFDPETTSSKEQSDEIQDANITSIVPTNEAELPVTVELKESATECIEELQSASDADTINALLCSVENQIEIENTNEAKPLHLPDDLFDMCLPNDRTENQYELNHISSSTHGIPDAADHLALLDPLVQPVEATEAKSSPTINSTYDGNDLMDQLISQIIDNQPKEVLLPKKDIPFDTSNGEATSKALQTKTAHGANPLLECLPDSSDFHSTGQLTSDDEKYSTTESSCNESVASNAINTKRERNPNGSSSLVKLPHFDDQTTSSDDDEDATTLDHQQRAQAERQLAWYRQYQRQLNQMQSFMKYTREFNQL